MNWFVIKVRSSLNPPNPKRQYNKGKSLCCETDTILQPSRDIMQVMYCHIINGLACINIGNSS